MGFVRDIIAAPLEGLGQGLSALLGGFGGDTPQEFPGLPDEKESVIDDEILSQQDKVRQLKRIQNKKNRSLTGLQDNPVDEDSLLRILARGE